MPFDEYTLKARIWPSFIVCSPILLFGPIVASRILNLFQTCVGSAVLSVAVIALVSAVIRQLGVGQEEEFFKKWGGPPSTRFMRWRDSHWSTDYKQKLHELVRHKLGISLSSEEGEKEDSDAADKKIKDAFSILRYKLRGNKKFLTHKDNIDYGFARNLYGARWLWLFFSFFAVTALFVWPMVTSSKINAMELGCAIIYLVGVIYVEWVILRKHVKHCALRYVESSWCELANV